MTRSEGPEIDERTIELITDRVVTALRDELETIAMDLIEANGSRPPLTVGDVAERFGIARSTVYAHWRAWGGYKLGSSEKAPIRFDEASLPVGSPADAERARSESRPQVPPNGKRRPRRDLLNDSPKSEQLLDSTG